MGRGFSWMSVGVLWVAAAACGESHDEVDVITADSAGIEIVTNKRTFGEMPLRKVAVEFETEILDDALYRVTAVQPLRDGRVAVSVNGSSSVLLYDAAGERISQLGRRGEGPGEFRMIQSLVPLPGDSLGVYDPLLRRLTVYPFQEGAPRVLGLHEIAPGGGWSRVYSLPTGLAFVGEAGAMTVREAGIHRGNHSSYHIDLDGWVMAEYGEFPGNETFVSDGASGSLPFGKVLFTATEGDRFIVGTGEEPELRMYRPDGALARIVRWQDQDRTVTQERVDEFLEFVVSQAPPEHRGPMRERITGIPFAPQAPTHAEILVSPSGDMWLGEYPGPEAQLPTGATLPARRWVLFGPDGAMKERIETPPGFLPLALEAERVWGVYHNELDVESIRAYRTRA